MLELKQARVNFREASNKGHQVRKSQVSDCILMTRTALTFSIFLYIYCIVISLTMQDLNLVS